jgi:sensor histidine kinase regulating citrate/malate metabolism
MFSFILNFKESRKLLDTITIYVMSLVLLLMLSIGGIFSNIIYDIVENQTAKRAVQSANHVAYLPVIKDIIKNRKEPAELLSIKEYTGASLIMVTNSDGGLINSSVGDKLEDLHLEKALKYGRTYISKQFIDDKHVIMGISPVMNHQYDVIGTVMVGYFMDSVRKMTDEYREKEIFFLFVFITVGLLVAIYIAKAVKRAIFGFEPFEIASLFRERNALIASIREGVISTDKEGRINLINESAQKYLRLRNKKSIRGKYLSEYIPELDVSYLLETGAKLLDRELVVRGNALIFNTLPIVHDEKIIGTVTTFRKKDEIEVMENELSQVQTYSDMLRAQTHEYSNRLHTIVGMVQIGAHDEILDFIAAETTEQRLLVRFLTENIPDHALSSLIIGKYMYAMENKIDFVIDQESHMTDIPDGLNRHSLVTIIGNVLSNALEAALASEKPKVVISMSDYGNELIFEIEDSGKGIPDDMADEIFNKGISTKEKTGRGYGLYLARKSLMQLQGSVIVGKSSMGGALFIITIPKNGAADETY